MHEDDVKDAVEELKRALHSKQRGNRGFFVEVSTWAVQVILARMDAMEAEVAALRKSVTDTKGAC